MYTIIAALIAVLGGLLGYYFLECLHAARRQKLTAVRLEADLSQFLINISNRSGLYFLYHIGHKWSDKLSKTASEKGVEGLFEIEKEFQEMLAEIKTKIKENPEANKGLKELYTTIKGLDEKVFLFELDGIKQIINNIEKNRDFISDEDAANLSLRIVFHFLGLKAHMEALLSAIIILHLTIRSMKTFQSEKVHEQFFMLIKHFVLISRYINPILEDVRKINRNSTLALAFEKMFSGD